MNFLTIIIILLTLQANNITVPKEAWIVVWTAFILKSILATIRNYIIGEKVLTTK